MAIQNYKDLLVHQLSFTLAMDIYWLSRKFPREELYSLTDQDSSFITINHSQYR